MMKWEEKPLGDVCETGSGGTPLRSMKDYYEGGDIPWLLSGEVAQGEVKHAENYITQKGLDNSSAKLFPKNTVLVAMYGATAGQVGILRFTSATNQAVCGIKPGNRFIPEFLFYLFLQRKEELVAQAVGGAQPNISQEKIRNTLVPLPPLPEQQRIVGKLDAAFAALSEAQALVERNRANARELFESYLNGVFERKGDGWVEKQLTDVARIRTGKVDANHQAGDGKYAFYTCAFGQFKSPTWSFEGPSVILPGNGANVGVTFFYDGRFEAYQRTYVVNEFGAEVNPRYAYFCFRAGWKPYIATRQFGSATNYIVLGDLKQFPVHLPSLKEQAILLGEFEEMEQHVLELETTYQQKLSDLDALKKGLLGAAFRGEL